MSEDPVDVIVLGAGPAGLSAALALLRERRRRLASLCVVERAEAVGGLARSHEVFGCRVDFGPHAIGLGEPEVAEMFQSAIGQRYDEFALRTAMLWNGATIEQQINPLVLARRLGPSIAFRAATSMIAARISGERAREVGFVGRSRRRFGSYMSRRCVEPYARRLWGESLDDLSEDWAPAALKRPAGVSGRGGMSLRRRHLVIRHPWYGIGTLYESLAEMIVERGGVIRLRTTAIRAIRSGRRIVGVECCGHDGVGAELPLKAGRLLLVSTLPMMATARLLGVPSDQANASIARVPFFRATANVFALVERRSSLPFHIAYVNESAIATGRVTNYSRWSRGMQPPGEGADVVGCEYWMWPEELRLLDPRWLVERADADLRSLGCTPVRGVAPHVIGESATHPVPSRTVLEAAGGLHATLSRFENLVMVGRGGRHRYADQDAIVLDGMRVARLALDHLADS